MSNNDNRPHFDMVPLNSTSISSAGYDEASETLAIEFNSGKTYYYSEVPETVFEELKSAESPGKFFSTQIKDVYNFEKD